MSPTKVTRKVATVGVATVWVANVGNESSNCRGVATVGYPKYKVPFILIMENVKAV